MTTSNNVWMGSTDKRKSSPLDYFIPESLQAEVGLFRSFIAPFVTEQRISRMEGVLRERTRQVLPVFENTHHTHNISAVLRTMDALGYQDVIQLYSDSEMRFRLKDTVERGSSQWLGPRRSKSFEQCLDVLKKSGCVIGLVSLPTFFKTAGDYESSKPSFSSAEFQTKEFEEMVSGKKIALVFGNEASGVEAQWHQHADFYTHVNMYGFVESLNLSVCAGILLSSLREAAQKSLLSKMPSWEQTLLLDHWLAKDTDRASELIENQKPELWCYFDFVKRGLFWDPFGDIGNRSKVRRL